MTGNPAISAAKNFLEVVWEGDAPSDAELTAALDRLLLVYSETPEMDYEAGALDPPDIGWKKRWDQAAKRFPDFGFYAVADTLHLDTAGWSIGDAVDDVADITGEINDVVFYSEHEGAEQALKHFCSMYSHWGKHARDLLQYLFAGQFGLYDRETKT